MSTKLKKETEEETEGGDLVDYEPDEKDEDDKQENSNNKEVKKGHVAIHSSGFRDFLLKLELLRAVIDCGFEHPSEVQHQCIPQAILGMDLICQAKSGMGKTAVFVLAVLQQMEIVQGQCQCLVLCHTRELAFQICKEFDRFCKYLKDIKTKVFYGGVNIKEHRIILENEKPNIVIGTPGRVLQLVKEKSLDISKIRYFVLDECDKMLDSIDMRRDVQEIFKYTPHDKQVMMFSATLSEEVKPIAKKFMSDPIEIYVDEKKLILHGLNQYYVKLKEEEKNRKLISLLDSLEFNQVVIFVRTVQRASALDKLLQENSFPSICIHRDLTQEKRIQNYQAFKNFEKRILVSTDIFGRGMDIERVNIVINYDMPDDSDQYLHRVGRAGRFGTRGLAVSFISPTSSPSGNTRSRYVREKTDEEVLQDVQKRFIVKIDPLPDKIETSSYMSN